MNLEDFIKPYAEKLQLFKKNIFTYKHAHDFLQKLCERGDLEKMESELSKCLLNTTQHRESDERKFFISNFIDQWKKYSNERGGNIQSGIKVESSSSTDPGKKSQNQNKEFELKKFKIKNKEEEFPTLENLELVNRKKQFEVLDHHYTHKLEKGNKICFCMSSKHPLVGNCVQCGRIQCLQEGDKECIVCGSAIIKKDEYLKQCTDDRDMKKAYMHKEKLLKFQADFYSKLQIIDDFSDWYEISNNTWISKEHRELAKKKDEEIDRIREDPQYEYNINFKTLEVTKVYEQVDDTKMRNDITNFFMESLRKSDKEKDGNGSHGQKISKSTSQPQSAQPSQLSCQGITEKALTELTRLANKRHDEISQKISYEQNIKKLSKRIDLNNNEKIGDEMVTYSKNLFNIELMTENDNFESESVMCLSMHQPWASLLIEGFKRFEGREWDSDFRGQLWIHATSKKPEQELIDSVEGECRELYKNCTNAPKFPKRYPTSCLLGCVDVVDVLKKESYMKLIPNAFRERSDSKYLFVCKNPRRLEIPIKMPGQPNIYKLEENILERTKGKLVKVNTFWWPCSGLSVNLIDIPFNLLLKPENVSSSSTMTYQHAKKNKPTSNKVKVTNLIEENNLQSMILIQHYLTRDKLENILSFVESIKKDMGYFNDYLQPPYLNYGLNVEFNNNSMPLLLSDLFKEISHFFRDEKKIKLHLNLKSATVEYIDWYGCQNFKENKNKTIKLFIGNPLVLSTLSDYSDIQGRSVRFECGDIIYLDQGLLYAINQVFYDMMVRNIKMKQGVVVISFNCSSD
jgi:activating signal cointegrator 1